MTKALDMGLRSVDEVFNARLCHGRIGRKRMLHPETHEKVFVPGQEGQTSLSEW
jgi:hypothetical protein